MSLWALTGPGKARSRLPPLAAQAITAIARQHKVHVTAVSSADKNGYKFDLLALDPLR